MEYAIQLLLPIIGGLWLGNWLNRTYGLPSIWTLILAILGMMAGLGILYKRYALQRTDKAPFPPGKPKPFQKNPKQDTEKRLELHELDFLYKNHDDNDEHPWKDDDA
jgi:hypothetical protein